MVPIHERKWARNVSNSEMSDFSAEQGRTRIFGEAYFLYAATGKLRRTPLSGKMAIYGWTLIIPVGIFLMPMPCGFHDGLQIRESRVPAEFIFCFIA